MLVSQIIFLLTLFCYIRWQHLVASALWVELCNLTVSVRNQTNLTQQSARDIYSAHIVLQEEN